MAARPVPGSLEEFDTLVHASAVSARCLVGGAAGFAFCQAVGYLAYGPDSLGWILTFVFSLAVLCGTSIWAGQAYATGTGRNRSLAVFVAGFGALVPGAFLFGYVALQLDLAERLRPFGLRLGPLGPSWRRVADVRGALLG